LIGTIGIMDIAGTVLNVKELASLSDCTKQRIVTVCTLFGFIEADSRRFCMSLGGLN